MILLLQVIAVVLTVLGVVTLYLGNDPSMLSLGNTLMIVGAISAVGGLVLFGLAVIAARLDTLARGIDGLKFGLAPSPAFAPAVAPILEPAPRHDDLGIAPAAETASDTAVPLTPSVEPYRAEPMAVAGASIEPIQPEPARIEPVPVVSRPVEPVQVEPAAPAPAVTAPAAPAVEFPKRPTSFRDRFGWKPAAAATGVAAAAAAAATAAKPGQAAGDPPAPSAGQTHEAGEAVETAEAPGTRQASTQDPAVGSGDALEAAIGGVVADLRATIAAPPAVAPVVVPSPPPPRHVEDDDLMARLRASILGPEPVPASNEPEVRPVQEPAAPALAEQTGEPVEAPAAETAEPAKAAKFSIEDELEMALKAALGRDVAPPAADLRHRFVPPPAVSSPEPPADRPAPPSGEHAMAALARDFPELGDILAPPANAGAEGRERGDPVVTGQDADDVHDSHALAADADAHGQGEAGHPAVVPAGVVEAPPVVAARPEAAAAVEAAPAVQAEPASVPATTAPLLREGVIAGIPFRLFGDGSIEADLATGTARFASLKDFRAHVGG
ncbi:MAG: hypothetical protein ACRCVA_34400 [Phreatobacter sp.]